MQTPIDFFLSRLKEELPKDVESILTGECYKEAKEYEEAYKQKIYQEANLLASSREYWNEKRTTH
jgi:hypothetical protein